MLLILAASLWAAASIAGTWDVSSVDPHGNPIRATLTMKEDGGKLVGSLTVEGLLLGMSDAHMSGDAFTCKVTHEGRVFDVKMKVAGDSLEGVWESSGGRKGNLKGKRSKS
jgi:sugar lactone lactonase YvrE